MFRCSFILLGMVLCVNLLLSTGAFAVPSYSPQASEQLSQPAPNVLVAAQTHKRSKGGASAVPSPASIAEQSVSRQMHSSLRPSDTMDEVGNLQATLADSANFMEIEVSHSDHMFKLIENAQGKRQILYQCKIGLGSSEFPTPVGTYYVTHIYDDKPWWIPPKDRAWAAGDSPSQKVYGGTMAPLLKKRPMRNNKQQNPLELEDLIAGPVQLDDYGYRFHGTNAPRSIGRNQSHGCVRMISADAGQVAAIIKEKVGVADRREAENGPYALLNQAVRLNLIK